MRLSCTAGIRRLSRVGALAMAFPLSAPCISSAQTVNPTSGSHAQGAVLTGSDVNESRLLEALIPAQSASAPDGIKTRQLRIQSTPTAPPARRPAASLLITFETNSALLTAAARSQLDVVAAALKNVRLESYRFNVEGHADPRGSPEANRVLSQQRAESVRDYLVNTRGIAPERLQPLGKGDSELMNPRSPTAPENRRVTIATLQQ